MIRRAAVSVPITAARESAWSMLADLEQSVAWLPTVESARILTTEGDISVVELTVNGAPIVLEVIASPPDEARFEQVDRRAKEGISGRWSLREDDAGGLVLDAEIRVPQPLFAFGSGRRLDAALKRAVAIVADRIRRPPTAHLVSYRRAIAVIRRGDVIEARIGDEVVELCRIGAEE